MAAGRFPFSLSQSDIFQMFGSYIDDGHDDSSRNSSASSLPSVRSSPSIVVHDDLEEIFETVRQLPRPLLEASVDLALSMSLEAAVAFLTHHLIPSTTTTTAISTELSDHHSISTLGSASLTNAVFRRELQAMLVTELALRVDDARRMRQVHARMTSAAGEVPMQPISTTSRSTSVLNDSVELAIPNDGGINTRAPERRRMNTTLFVPGQDVSPYFTNATLLLRRTQSTSGGRGDRAQGGLVTHHRRSSVPKMDPNGNGVAGDFVQPTRTDPDPSVSLDESDYCDEGYVYPNNILER